MVTDSVFLRDIVRRVINDTDNNVRIAAVHAQEPVIVVSAEGRWKVEMIAAVKEVDGAGLATELPPKMQTRRWSAGERS